MARNCTLYDVRMYAEHVITALLAGKLPEPGRGECEVCAMRTSVEDEAGHIEEHVASRELVPSLLWRSVAMIDDWNDVIWLIRRWKQPPHTNAMVSWERRERLKARLIEWLSEKLSLSKERRQSA